MVPPIDNKAISFCTGVAGLFLPPKAGFLSFVAFLLACRQARMGVAGNIREPALEIFPATHGRKGQGPEKAQIFL